MGWRNEFYEKLKQEKFSKSFTDAKKLLQFIEKEFYLLVDPIDSLVKINKYPMDQLGRQVAFDIEDKRLIVEVSSHRISFSKKNIHPNPYDKIAEFIQNDDDIFYDQNNNLITKETIDNIFKMAFYEDKK